MKQELSELKGNAKVDPDELKGSVAVVTGAGGGIGLASATLLAEMGARVSLWDLGFDKAEDTIRGLREAALTIDTRKVDVRDRATVFATMAEVAADLGNPNILCNAAAIINAVPVLEVTPDTFDPLIEVNLKGTLYTAQAAATFMQRNQDGSIVNFASRAIDSPPLTGNMPYAVTKAAVVQLSKNLAWELAGDGIRVNVIAPGFVDTPMTQRHDYDAAGDFDPAKREARLGGIREMTPLGFIAEPRDMAWLVGFLAGERSRFITGQVIRPNGGAAMP